MVRARQRRMIVRAPLVEAEQDGSIQIENLPPIRMGRLCLRLAEERLIPLETGSHITYADDCPRAFHDNSPRPFFNCLNTALLGSPSGVRSKV